MLALAAAAPQSSAARQGGGGGLTAVSGVTVGHHTLSERPTGCTVVLVMGGAVGSGDVRGAAPGTREFVLLDPVNTIQEVHGIVLAGGSAFGLAAAQGTQRFLEERGIGYDVGDARVPIVPSAILYDLGVGGRPDIRPTADCGYRAAEAATADPVVEGNVGAGAGATVGKLLGRARAMKAGIGSAAISTPEGLVVAALVAVNAVGDIIDPATGAVVAGATTADGRGMIDIRTLLRRGSLAEGGRPGENTTLAVVATNAQLDKAQVNKVAQMAHDGLARTIYPVHTPLDGDAVFALATGGFAGTNDLLVIGALAAEVLAQAVVRAARMAEGIPGYPAAGDLGRR
jgi:L-aminopeptidase/D-esterase-like protein